MSDAGVTDLKSPLPSPGFEVRRILVVDDTRDSRDVMAEFLKTQGHRVRTASDGMEALNAASQFIPEIIFSDLRMPRMDGFELCAHVRADPILKDAAVFAVTGYPNSPKGTRRAAAEFDAYLRKPIELAVVKALIDSTSAQLRAQLHA